MRSSLVPHTRGIKHFQQGSEASGPSFQLVRGIDHRRERDVEILDHWDSTVQPVSADKSSMRVVHRVMSAMLGRVSISSSIDSGTMNTPCGSHPATASTPLEETFWLRPVSVAWASGAKITPNDEVTMSNVSSPRLSERRSKSPVTNRTSAPASPARRRAISRSSSVRSIPVTSAPRRAASIATVPVPVATSSNVRLASPPVAGSTASSTDNDAVASQSPTIS